MSIKVYGDKIYEQQFSTRAWGKYPSEEVIRFFVRAKKELRGSDLKALDIGCGTGACSWTMAKEGAMVTAIDGAPSGLEKVNALAREFGVNATIEVSKNTFTNIEGKLSNGGVQSFFSRDELDQIFCNVSHPFVNSIILSIH